MQKLINCDLKTLLKKYNIECTTETTVSLTNVIKRQSIEERESDLGSNSDLKPNRSVTIENTKKENQILL
jgi:hypothetical protein